jgi:hypothetical protein
MKLPRDIAHRIATSAIEGAQGQTLVERAGVITSEERRAILGCYEALVDRQDEIETAVMRIIKAAKPAADEGWER